MVAPVKSCFLLLVLASLLPAPSFAAEDSANGTQPMTGHYSQKELLKNWALSVCLATVAEDEATKADANATASAYMEYGRQEIEAYEQLHEMVKRFAARQYSGSIDSQFNTMKCIDLFQSRELDKFTGQLTKEGKARR